MRHHTPLLLILLLSPALNLRGDELGKVDLQKRETQLLARVRSGKDNSALVELAAVREQRGRFREAIATWNQIKQSMGSRPAPNQSGAPERTWNQIADFWIVRLHRKIALATHPIHLNTRLRQRLAAARRSRGFKLAREGQIDLSVEVDLDGDRIDEVFHAGRYGTLGKRDQPFMALDKWNGSQYETIWQAEEKNKPIIFPTTYKIADKNGDGWKAISLGFEAETENVATLYFNGKDAIMLWVSLE